MLKRNEKQVKIFSGTLEELVPQNHFLRKVDKLVDFDFIHEKVAPYYCENNGRPSADPVMLMKMLLLGYLYGIDSERKVKKKNTKKVTRNGKKLSVKKIARNLTDPESGLLFRNGKPRIFGYLSHETIDAKNGIIVGVMTTPANVTDNVVHNDLVMKAIETFHFDTEAIAADSGYDSSEIYAEFYKHGIKTFIVPQKEKNVFEQVDFSYNELTDMYTCPGGRQFGYFSYEKSSHLKIYRTKTGCDNCPKKNECAANDLETLKLGLHERERKAQRALFGTRECTEALRLRQVLCEGNFSRQKESHNLTRTRKRGLARVYEQCLLSSCALNLKRMVKCIGGDRFLHVIRHVFAPKVSFLRVSA